MAIAQSRVGQDRQDFYDRISEQSLAPLWRMLRGLVPASPQTPARPQAWRYSDIRPYLLEAADLIGTAEAERRVLMLENAALAGQARTTGSLYAGLQVIMPGEVAPPHRHAASALRFVIEGQDAWTAMDGERTWMRPGDFIVTPSWAWHAHGNEGRAPMVWMDGLDIHIVNLLDCGFREDEALMPPLQPRPDLASSQEYGANLLPMDADRGARVSPLFNYPYDRTREALEAMTRSRAVHPHDGYRLRYANPLNGDWAIPTIATWMQLLPAGFTTAPRRSTDGTILVVVEGAGHSIVGGQRLDWSPKDILVVPSWIAVTHHAETEAVIFGASDRATQEKLGLWRESWNEEERLS